MVSLGACGAWQAAILLEPMVLDIEAWFAAPTAADAGTDLPIQPSLLTVPTLLRSSASAKRSSERFCVES
jgi:hypothetical protein